MDPISIIVTALVAGLTSGITRSASEAVTDTYFTLRERISLLLKENEDGQDALVKIEKDPASEGRQIFLAEELTKVNAERDLELVQLAQEFLERIDQEGARAGKYQVSIRDAQGVVIGDHAKVRQSFRSDPKK